MRRKLSPASMLSLILALLTYSVIFKGPDFHTSANAQTKHYICPPCGLPCDKSVFDKPGACPKCGMTLVDEESVTTAAPVRKKVAILIFTGVQIIDYTGPYEVFGAANFDVYTVAETKDPITTVMGMTVVPKYTFADAPQPDVLVVPGGGVTATQNDSTTLKWITDITAHTAHTMSVCNGAFILARAGLLDGLSATTTAGNIERLKSGYPKIKVVGDQRVVDNGKIITTGGLSAGIDGALHVVGKMLGNGRAQQVALGEEYDWSSHSRFARATLADMQIPDFTLDGYGKWETVSTEGGTDHWDFVMRGTSDKSAAELMDHLSQTFETAGKWTRIEKAAGSPSPTTRKWKFTGRGGKAWTGTLMIRPIPRASKQYTAKLTVALEVK